MDRTHSVWDTVKLGMKLIGYKVTQYGLGTNEYKQINTKSGPIRGRKRKTIYNDVYWAFEGIPYAEPPIGELRFRAPQPAKSWTSVLDCTTARSKPVQEDFILHNIQGSEDCLYINVYASNLKTEKPLPVLIWIYGGAFNFGEASRDLYGPDYFMKQDVILVTLNYRVGALGFLSLNDPDIGVPGNAGLKDQLLALQWLKENITCFNGDANNITLFGVSAGGASCHFMMLTEKTKGLFHKAVLQSGCVLCPWANAPPRKWPYRLAVELGYNGTDNDKEVYRFLMKSDAKKIASIRLHTKEEHMERIQFPFGPVVEPYEDESSLFIRPFKELLSTSWSNSIPIIIGGTSFEGLFSCPTTMKFPYEINELEDCVSVLPPEVKQSHSPEELREMGLRLKQLYFGNKKPCIKESLFEYLDLLSYLFFWHDLHRSLRARLTYCTPNTPTYLYRFDFDSIFFNHYRILNCGQQIRGVSHADDVSYLFYNVLSSKLSTQSLEYKTMERMVSMWTAFAATSNPNCDSISPTEWKPVQITDAKQKCLNINETIEFIDMPEADKLKVWDSLYVKASLF